MGSGEGCFWGVVLRVAGDGVEGVVYLLGNGEKWWWLFVPWVNEWGRKGRIIWLGLGEGNVLLKTYKWVIGLGEVRWAWVDWIRGWIDCSGLRNINLDRYDNKGPFDICLLNHKDRNCKLPKLKGQICQLSEIYSNGYSWHVLISQGPLVINFLQRIIPGSLLSFFQTIGTKVVQLPNFSLQGLNLFIFESFLPKDHFLVTFDF